MARTAIRPGAEPFSAEGGPHGALVLHGFTGSPQSMRPLAHALAAEGFAVELPRLPGHGTSLDDLLGTDWSDWSSAADAVYLELTARVERVVLVGLSMGATLATWLATRHPEVAGLVLVNPLLAPLPVELRGAIDELVAQGVATMPAVGGDIADPAQEELAYEATPVAALASLLTAVDELQTALASITAPVLLMTSAHDHVVPVGAADVLARELGGRFESVVLERSYHVATLDYDAPEIERRAVDFARRVVSEDRAG
jgi:carboxylesterase